MAVFMLLTPHQLLKCMCATSTCMRRDMAHLEEFRPGRGVMAAVVLLHQPLQAYPVDGCILLAPADVIGQLGPLQHMAAAQTLRALMMPHSDAMHLKFGSL